MQYHAQSGTSTTARFSMLSSQRRKLIADLIRSEGQVVVHELSAKWKISEDAIRRDLRELARQGLLQRVHGGAISASPAAGDYAQRQELSTEIKNKLGRS